MALFNELKKQKTLVSCVACVFLLLLIVTCLCSFNKKFCVENMELINDDLLLEKFESQINKLKDVNQKMKAVDEVIE